MLILVTSLALALIAFARCALETFKENERTTDADCRGGQIDVAWIGARSPYIMRDTGSGSGPPEFFCA
jgi:hypothetical protein